MTADQSPPSIAAIVLSRRAAGESSSAAAPPAPSPATFSPIAFCILSFLAS
jgi:hypothetical protein